MSKDEIKKILGEPDSEMFDYLEMQENKKLTGSSWGYYLKRFDRELATVRYDEAVFLSFNTNETLYWAQLETVAGLKSLGGPHLKDR